jgi:hypothetical protein
VLERIQEAPIRALQMCGNRVAEERFYDYPTQPFSWDGRSEGNPTLAALAKATGRAVMAGVHHRRIHRFKVFPGSGHFVTNQATAACAPLLVEHLRAHAGRRGERVSPRTPSPCPRPSRTNGGGHGLASSTRWRDVTVQLS